MSRKKEYIFNGGTNWQRRYWRNLSIIERFQHGEEIPDIARSFNITTATVFPILKAVGIKPPYLKSRVLVEERRIAYERIRKEREAGATFEVIAGRHGISRQRVHQLYKQACQLASP